MKYTTKSGQAITEEDLRRMGKEAETGAWHEVDEQMLVKAAYDKKKKVLVRAARNETVVVTPGYWK